MLDITSGVQSRNITGQEASDHKAPRERMVLRMVKHERMGGSVPVWVKISGSEEKQAGKSAGTGSFRQALTYQSAEGGAAQTESKPFGFGDLIDMVNPLHHIPLIGQVYRHLTGDEIRPASQIIGGSVFGGPAGGAINLAGVVIKEETGKTLAENTLAFVLNGEKPSFKSARDEPESRLAEAITKRESSENAQLPGSVLSFADLGGGRRMVYETVPVAGGRTAGTMVRKHIEQVSARHVAALPPRAPISTLNVEALLAFEETKKMES